MDPYTFDTRLQAGRIVNSGAWPRLHGQCIEKLLTCPQRVS